MPPYLRNDKNITSTELTRSMNALSLGEDEKTFLTYLLNKTMQAQQIDLVDCCEELDLKAAALRKRLKKYKDLGLFTTKQTKAPNVRRPVNVYGFENINDISTEIKGRPDRRIVTNVLSAVSSEVESKVLRKAVDPRIDDLMLSTLYSALPLTTPSKFKAPRKKRVNMFGTWINLSVETDSGGPGAGAKDIRYIIVLYTMVYELIKEQMALGQGIENRYIVALGDINDSIGEKKTGTYVETTKKAVERLARTSFMLNKIPVKSADRWDFSKDSRLRIINDEEIIYQEKTSDKMRAYLVFSLPHYIFTKMIASPSDFFLVNPKLPHEKLPELVMLYLYLKRVMSHRLNTYSEAMSGVHKNLSIDEPIDKWTTKILKSLETRPQIVSDDANLEEGWEVVEETVTKMIKGKAFTEVETLKTRTFDLYGFIVCLEKDPYVFHISKDPQDPILGAGSIHKRVTYKVVN